MKTVMSWRISITTTTTRDTAHTVGARTESHATIVRTVATVSPLTDMANAYRAMPMARTSGKIVSLMNTVLTDTESINTRHTDI
jgi:hypothetical protein